MEALNGNVFIKRDPTEKQLFDIDISENLLVKSGEGVVEHLPRSYKNVISEGDRTLVPHYNVQDCEVDGIEYAVAKLDELFVIKKGNAYRPINRYVKIRKCEEDHVRDESGEIALYMTQEHIEFTHWVEIVDVADDCKYIKKEHIGLFCIAPEADNRLCRILRTKDFCLHEDEIHWLTTGD